MRFRNLAAVSLLLATLTCFLCSPVLLDAQTVTLKLIETTDVHGAVFPYDFINDRDGRGSLAQVMTYLKEERGKDGQQVLLLDAGDFLQGQPVVYYYNFEKTDAPHLYARVMNYMKYDAAAVGNHDIETGHAVYDKFAGELDFPWLAANAVRTGVEAGEPYFKPYTVLEKSGVKIVILGMVTPGIPMWLPAPIWSGMEYLDMVETARKWVPIIQRKENPDLLVGLFHAGVDETYGGVTADTPKNENASRLVAEQAPGFDIVFVGHDHQGWNFTVNNVEGRQVLVLGASANARDVAVATVKLEYDFQSKAWRKTVTGESVDVSGFEPDSAFISTFSSDFDQVKAYVGRRIGAFTDAISTREAMFGESRFVDLIHRIQLELTDADLSAAAPLSFDATIEKGPVYVRDMFNLYKFENLLYTMRLTGREVKGYLEHSYGGWFQQMASADDHLLNFSRDQAGELIWSNRSQSYKLAVPVFSYDSMAGLKYTVDVSKPAGQRVVIRSMTDGAPFRLDATYKVAVNSYRGNGGGGHLTRGAGIPKSELPERIISSSEKDLRYYMMKWIEKSETITPAAFGNWRVVPQDWWQAASRRDFELLYGSDRSKTD